MKLCPRLRLPYTPPRPALLALAALALAVLSIASSACSEQEEQDVIGPECGEGTTEIDNECIASEVICGPGTLAVSDGCVRESPPLRCGDRTEQIGDECQARAELGCGEGADLVNGECVAPADMRCGEGTAPSGRECVIDERLVCGSGTRRVGDTCVPAPDCGAGSIQVGDACVADWTLGEEPPDVCRALAAELCDQIASCCGTASPTVDTFFDEAYRIPFVCREAVASACFRAIDRELALLTLGEVDIEGALYDQLAPYYRVDECRIAAASASVLNTGPPIDELVSPTRGFNEPCLDNASCHPGLSCVTDAEGDSRCRTLGTTGVRCDRFDSADCGPAFYCESSAEPSVCAPRPGVNEDCTDRPCNGEEAFCSSGVCIPLAGDGGACLNNASCQAGLFCYERACRAYVELGEDCDRQGQRCQPGLYCDADVCVDEMALCDLLPGGDE